MSETKRRLRFGIDVDGVLYEWDRTARYMLRAQFDYPKDGPLGQPSTYWNSIQDVVKPDQWNWLWNTGVKMGLFRYGHLYTGAIEGIRDLATKGDVVVITHRPRSAVLDTLDWLSYLRLPFTEIHLLTSGEPKSNVRPQCDIYVDDKPENISDYYDHTTGTPLLWTRPWNATWWRDPLHRVESWQEVSAYVAGVRP